jgi:DNA-binding SARP family transcriptional activator
MRGRECQFTGIFIWKSTVVSSPVFRDFDGSDMRLHLLSGFRLCDDEGPMALPSSGQRLVALVALRNGVTREQASGILWPDTPQLRAGARLRTALWRLSQSGRRILCGAHGQLFLDTDLTVDMTEWLTLALCIIDRPESVATMRLAALHPGGELLPGWYDDWVLLERERVRQLQLHVLEAAAEHLLTIGHHAAALELALGAVRFEPTRESAHRLVIRVHLAEGNLGEARRQFRQCELTLMRHLGAQPSDQLRTMVSVRRCGHP